jgi:hypothetical protein
MVESRAAKPTIARSAEGKGTAIQGGGEPDPPNESEERAELLSCSGREPGGKGQIKPTAEHVSDRDIRSQAVGEKFRHDRDERTKREPGILPERHAHTVTNRDNRDAPVKGKQSSKPGPVGARERDTGRVKRGTIQSAPDPARPRLVGGGVEAVEEFDTEAKVEIGEGADTEPPFLMRAADVLLDHKALSAGDLVSRSPENGAPGTVKSG